MSWLDKLTKGVKDVINVVEGGALDKVITPGTEQSKANAPATETPKDDWALSGSDSEIVAAAVAGGALDVGALFSPTEIESLIGAAVGAPELYVNQDWIGWEWQSIDGSGQYAGIRTAYDVAGGFPHEPNDFWDGYMRPRYGSGTHVSDIPGVGDDAFRVGTQVYARFGDHIVYTMGDSAESLITALGQKLA